MKEIQSYREIAKRLHVGETVCRITKISEERYLEEIFSSGTSLVICGGGHISYPLCNMAKMLGYHVTVIDDREEFANVERFDQADCVHCMNFEDAFVNFSFPEDACYVIVTRGHQNDYECLKAILKKKSSYVGMIGSKIKVKATFERLQCDGFTKEQQNRVHAPIGLPIAANTPEEIAISILAEIIQEKRKLHYTELSEEVVEWLLHKNEKMMMMTIVAKKGSAPRGVGTRMLITADGAGAGTIGGGTIEYLASQEAIELLREGKKAKIGAYNLTTKEAVNIGMICGGYIEILFEEVSCFC